MLVVLDIGVPTAWQVLDPLQRWLKTFCHIQRSNTGGDSVLRHQLELFLKENNTVWLMGSLEREQANDSTFVFISIYDAGAKNQE
ncbi:hypothetical protein RRG08_047579 [Elysia crispata]|uniref:Uncharacterized protein n=1 Tax=Elysia crispata TaxID=231223 RepID=A0AAE1E2F6_9GAST|nr:hypothetical protein RRG08_047579 [Elysia crispata]